MGLGHKQQYILFSVLVSETCQKPPDELHSRLDTVNVNCVCACVLRWSDTVFSL